MQIDEKGVDGVRVRERGRDMGRERERIKQ
jgi:hypothetical protein